MPSLPKPHVIMTKTRAAGHGSGLPGARHIRSSRNDRPYHYMVHSKHFAYEEYALHLGQVSPVRSTSPATAPATGTASRPPSLETPTCRSRFSPTASAAR